MKEYNCVWNNGAWGCKMKSDFLDRSEGDTTTTKLYLTTDYTDHNGKGSVVAF